MTCTEKKPEGIPYFYEVRGIVPTPGNDWVCDNGVWVWRASGQEKAQEPEASEKFESQFVECKSPQGFHKIDGEYRQVCKDLRGYYYISDFQRYSLSLGWVYNNITKPKAEAILPKEDPLTDILRDPETGRWLGAGVSEKVRASFDKVEAKLGNIASPGAGLKAMVGLVGVIILVLLFLVALGYSGLGGAAGKAAEKRV